MVCLHGQGGLSQCGHLADKGGGSNFRDFVRMSFMTAPNQVSKTEGIRCN